MTTSTRMPAVGLFAVILLAACAGTTTPGGSAQTGATGQSGATAEPDGTASSMSDDPGLISGTWSGTLTHHVTRTTLETDDSGTSSTTETYDATVKISSTVLDINGWTLAGPATIRATSTGDSRMHYTSTLGTCDKHYHDDDLAEGMSVTSGGLGINDDGTYEFNLNIPGFEGGTETALRDETGCLGSSNTYVSPWPVGPDDLSESGEMTDPAVLSGSSSKPVADGGEDTVTWRFTLTP